MRSPFSEEESYLVSIVFEQAGKIRDLSGDCDAERERADRFDEGICCMEWTLSRHPNANVSAVPVMLAMKMLGEVVGYATVGLRPPWMEAAMEGMGR